MGSTPFAALTLAVHTTQAGNAPWKYRLIYRLVLQAANHRGAQRGPPPQAEYRLVCARRRPGGARSATRSRPRPRSLQSLRSPLAPPSGYTRSGFAPCAPGTAPQHRLATLRYACYATAGPAVRYHNTGAPGQCRGRRAAAGPQSRLPPGATPAPPRAAAFVVGAGRRRTSGAVRLARVAPPVLSACRSIPRCAALAIPDHHPLRPPWLHARAHADCSLRSQPAPRQPPPPSGSGRADCSLRSQPAQSHSPWLYRCPAQMFYFRFAPAGLCQA